jgi:hypothetical protein
MSNRKTAQLPGEPAGFTAWWTANGCPADRKMSGRRADYLAAWLAGAEAVQVDVDRLTTVIQQARDNPASAWWFIAKALGHPTVGDVPG